MTQHGNRHRTSAKGRSLAHQNALTSFPDTQMAPEIHPSQVLLGLWGQGCWSEGWGAGLLSLDPGLHKIASDKQSTAGGIKIKLEINTIEQNLVIYIM